MVISKTQKMRDIIKTLPKLNCGFCGFDNCGNYARALVEGKAQPGLCIGGPLVAQKICNIMGLKMPPMPRWELWTLRQRQRELACQLNILDRRVKALASRMEG
jgi:Na+-translocating ferredoxin:NAD+ oxidoreductase RNF subunit RnfB